MNSESQDTLAIAPQVGRGSKPAWTLAVLSPVIAELLGASTRLSTLFALIPEIMIWGCGAVLARELVRRRRLGWPSLLLLGLALSIAEEFLVQQTSLAPMPWIHAAPYGRAWGVSWLYFLFMLGYESVWVVIVPVAITENLFPERRSEPWLRTRGIVICSIVFLLGSRIAWYAWVHRVREMIFHLPPYHPAPAAFLSGAVAIVLLILVALALGRRAGGRTGTPPRPIVVALAAVLFGLPWYGVLVLAFRSGAQVPVLSFWIPFAAGLVWSAIAGWVFSRWTAKAAWGEMHTFAAAAGAIAVCVGGGYLGSPAWSRIDVIWQLVIDAAALVCLALLGRTMSRRA